MSTDEKVVDTHGRPPSTPPLLPSLSEPCVLCLFLCFPAVPHGEGNGHPFQYSCLENPMDIGAWWAAVHGVAKSRTRLSDKGEGAGEWG